MLTLIEITDISCNFKRKSRREKVVAEGGKANKKIAIARSTKKFDNNKTGSHTYNSKKPLV
ncbi:hypothetical protein DSM107010_32450 [Chroococcidiopsis cubana SAG 39.79]|uniref:Uncharacterized protein n=1 Tax=Chroococcidiopsis cubana SAG 39.79 TaxID=388085 RepID=A0AB37UJ96_9CYAN|nr:hypothetical protein C7B79_30015 [Chroococcidiopsis cubana CCALA 043]RUT11442.1 hypothetical protein DSM107010_32450 [Chroococcidiopsis cubana SAG 39.79]